MRFHTAKPLALARTPKFIRKASQITKKGTRLDKFSVVLHPLITEKDMKKMEDENTMVFVVGRNATKP